jgi:hypothetical protein
MFCVILAGLTLGALGHVAVQAQKNEVAVMLGRAQATYETLLTQRRHKQIEIGRLKSPGRLVDLARARLGMTPDPAGIRVVPSRSSGQPATAPPRPRRPARPANVRSATRTASVPPATPPPASARPAQARTAASLPERPAVVEPRARVVGPATAASPPRRPAPVRSPVERQPGLPADQPLPPSNLDLEEKKTAVAPDRPPPAKGWRPIPRADADTAATPAPDKPLRATAPAKSPSRGIPLQIQGATP